MVITETRGFIGRDLAAQARQVNSRNASVPDPLSFINDRSGRRLVWADAVVLVLITVLTALPYVGKLGFYSDDWYLLASFHADTAQHTFGIHSVLRDFGVRPFQGFYLAGLYKLFGLHPLGYHVVNTAVIAASMPLFYWLLLRLNVGRKSAFAATAILIVLPQLSTVRVWYAAFQIPLSMLAAWVSLHCQLRFARIGNAAWAVAAAVAAVISVGAYEIFAPLIAAFPVGLVVVRWQSDRRRAVVLLTLAALVGVLALAKFGLSDRPEAPELQRYVKGLIQFFRPDYDWRTDYAPNVFAAAEVHFWSPLLGCLRGVQALLRGDLGWVDAAAALAAALLAFWRIRLTESPGAKPWSNGQLLLLGFATFALGHAAFVIVPSIFFSPTGIANRALVAGAVGVALILVAGVRYLASLAGEGRRSLVLASVIAVIVFLGTLRVLQIANYWTEARPIEDKILAAARSDLKDVPAQSVVLLDNICPYHGPAVIFEAPWDVSGALSLAIGRPIRGDAVSPRMSLQHGGLATSIYGEAAFYPFGRNLYVYDPPRHRLAQLGDFAAARRYFREASATRTRCPRGYVGHGVLI
jgi:hypothetical protein